MAEKPHAEEKESKNTLDKLKTIVESSSIKNSALKKILKGLDEQYQNGEKSLKPKS